MYDLDEVMALLAHWGEFRRNPRLWILVRYADLDVGLRLLPSDEYRAVLLMGVLGLSTREAAPYEAVSHMTMSRRYLAGIERLVNYMNNGAEYT